MRTETIVKTYYTFDELDDDAKEKAREWYREGALDYDWYDYIHEDAKEIAGLFGLEIDKIYFSGFSSQGDGACFIGSYSYRKGSVKAVREYAPNDEALHSIVARLAAVQKKHFYGLSAVISCNSWYYHEKSMTIDVYGDDGNAIVSDDNEVIEAIEDFASWIYSRLEGEYDYLLSDECVDDMIRANEYEFGEKGRNI